MKAFFEITYSASIKNPLTFSIQDDQFRLNGLDITKEDIVLLLELTGHEVDFQSNDSNKFFVNALHSFGRLSPEDFYEVFDNFVCWDTTTRDRYRKIVPIVQLKLSPPSLN